MRLQHRDGQTVHLAYGTNVRPATDLRSILAQLDSDAVPVRKLLGVDVLGLGLWLAAPVASALAASFSMRRRLRSELSLRGLEVVTLNGFPYRDPAGPHESPPRGGVPPAAEPADAGSSRSRLSPAKRAVYRPDWTQRERLEYTLDLARVLCDLMPDDAERGSVSTVPVAWREPWDSDRADRADRLLEDLADGLAEITWHTGRLVRVGFEPEPGCLIETSAQAIEHLSDVDPTFLGICLDLAHLACAWESPADAVQALREHRLQIVKVQVSAALVAPDPTAAWPVLESFAEPRFPHPTRTPSGAGTDDLPEALDADLTGPLRVHVHVPLHSRPPAPLTTTLPVARAALAELFAGPEALTDHVEVETATWAYRLPAGEHSEDAAAEVEFAHAELGELGLRGPAQAPDRASRAPRRAADDPQVTHC
ncbi:sugar phosphate isomerase/epimerase [Hamadaea flava]|uniref:TIM barrel protein n=1 Tax=Hamadaea flava TaxID=1742688 RepID=A0ABV8LV59_9ACTN|nr:TIM barrel protein [Hamadaea flava]MCP2327514.1 sugar phosphate isomerase/epimerase [Hamadaea flava]